MKNIDNIQVVGNDIDKVNAYCASCKRKGLFTYYAEKTRCYSCPFCACDITSVYEGFPYNYCNSCNIIFDKGCLHYSDNYVKVYNAHIIQQWKFVPLNQYCTGMPVFANEREFFENYKYIQILEWLCMNYLNEKCSNDNSSANDSGSANISNANSNYNCSTQQREPTANFHF
jgi:hypothetical protein